MLCAFHRFEIWEPGRFPREPRLAFDLVELSDHYDALLFLVRDEPVFQGSQIAVTRDAAKKVTDLHDALAERREGAPHERRTFVLQCVWSMFAEDLGMIPGHRFTQIAQDLRRSPQRSSADDLGGLFAHLNDDSARRPEHGMYAGVPYANGRLFERPARLHLLPDELDLLLEASAFQWHEVQPQIFGTLLEGVIGRNLRWEVGAHYTHDAEMQEIIQPTIVRPWRERLDALASVREAEQAQADLMRFVVLDPACGAGNFLYLAYRELRRIERDIKARLVELRREAGLHEQAALDVYFPLGNMRGFEVEGFAVELARVTLWMGHRLAVEELALGERTLPLADLSGIQRADALSTPWPAADAIIGNPPYHGSQNLRSVLGDERVEWLKETFGCGVQDLCVYWFRKAADSMRPGDRAGLVGTNSISQNRARGAGLNHVVERGGVITDAISRRRWPGDAVVNVSIVNWVQRPGTPPSVFRLDGEQVAGISTRLRESLPAVEEYERLPANAGRAFQGPIPAGEFYLTPEEAAELLARPDASYGDVVRPYLVGEDIAEDPAQRPTRWVVDYGFLPLEQAQRYPAALAVVRERVKPSREVNRDVGFRERWWLFGRPRGEMRDALAGLGRYIAGTATGKRFLFAWQEPDVCPSNATNVFAFDDDYAMGVLCAAPHLVWAHAESSTLEDRPRYTPTTCFETYPWPQPGAAGREAIAAAARELIDRRSSICLEEQIGLTQLYNAVDDGAWTEIARLHRRLDAAVASAYGWTAAVLDDPLEVRRRLADLHGAISAGEVAYAPFAYRAD